MPCMCLIKSCLNFIYFRKKKQKNYIKAILCLYMQLQRYDMEMQSYKDKVSEFEISFPPR